MFIIQNLSVSVEQKAVLAAISLECMSGSLHVLMGPNGSGKSTLAYALMGHPKYFITQGAVTLDGNNLLELSVDKRARAGLFIAFQYSQEIPGVQMLSFLHEAYCAYTSDKCTLQEFKLLLYPLLDLLKLDHSFIYRDLNDGFSGGEKKRFELLQLLLLKPKVAILDEIDSGLDIDAIKLVAEGIKAAQNRNPAGAIILITHYQRILGFLSPDYVHIIYNGKLVASGDKKLSVLLEKQGYDGFLQNR